MKKLLLLLLALLLLSGCDLRNRKPSQDFIPSGESSAYTDIPATQPSAQITATHEKPVTAHGAAVVKKVLSDKGTYTDWKEKVWNYNFQIPYIDLASVAVNQINADIERVYRSAVSEQLALMEERQPLTITTVTYETFENGNILTLLVRKVDAAGSISYSAYNFNHVSGGQVTGEELLAEAGLTAEGFTEQVTQQLSAEFEKRFGQYAQTDSLFYATQQQKTLSEDNCGLDVPMYLDANGVLNVIATLYCVGLVYGTDLYVIQLSG